MLHGLLAHALAEALLSAPGMLGSLDLLFNPTGLLQSLGQAWQGLLLGPLAAIEARSPSQVSLHLLHASSKRDLQQQQQPYFQLQSQTCMQHGVSCMI